MRETTAGMVWAAAKRNRPFDQAYDTYAKFYSK